MTNADTINRALAEMEGECPHKRIHPWPEGLYKWSCLDCGDYFKEKPVSPDRLSDGAYILGLFIKLVEDGEYVHMYDVKYGHAIGDASYDALVCWEFENKNLLAKDKNFRHAIALAAIAKHKDEKEGENNG